MYEPAVVVMAQGKKQCFLGNKQFDYSAGIYLTLFLTMPLEVEIIEASQEKPAIMAAVRVDLNKIAAMLLKLDTLDRSPTRNEQTNASGIFSENLDDELLDPIVRLVRTLHNPADQLMLSESIIEEIYYRVICRDQTGSLQRMLQQRGQIQQISRAVEHIHKNMEEVVSVDELAGLVGMSASGFHRRFKEVMHLSPLQYAKSIKLFRAQTLLKEGISASEAGYLVGYNSPAQFSREYKRHFGFAPSATGVGAV